MRTAVSTHVAEILRDAGPKVADILSAESSHLTMFSQGLHARDIAKPTGVDPAKLGVYRG
jgi:hypothetical protein